MKGLNRNLLSLIVLLATCGGQSGVMAQTTFTDKCTAIIAAAEISSDSVRLHELFTTAWAHQMDQSPEWATYLGYSENNHRWRDNSLAAIDKAKNETLLEMEVLASIDRSKLTAEDKLNYDLYHTRTARSIEGSRFGSEFTPINQMGGPQQNIPQLLEMMSTATVVDCENILARLKGVPKVIDQTMTLMAEGLKVGITPPAITLRDVAAQFEAQIVDDPAEAPMLVAFANLPPSISAEDQTRILREAYRVYQDAVVPAVQKLHDYFVATYLPGCRQTISMSDLPDGKAWYAHRVKTYTTTDLTPEEIHQIGLSEVARIRGEMDKVIKASGFTGDYAAFCEFLRTDPQFYFETAEALLTEYRDICKRADPELIKLFGRLPRLPYGVKPVPAYSEKSQTTAYYQGGSLRAGRPGYFYANTYDLKSRPSWEMEALSLHEAVPGHHLQIALAEELSNLPEFRQRGWFTAYGEGWGLYAESLGEEMGFYDDPYSKFGQLTYEMWRAIRLVVDVGMHALGWSRQDAIDFFNENSCKAEHDIVVEVDRYIVWPGQALAYKIGELKIKELRAYATEQLGKQFDLRSFHDEILRHGPLPLDVLETRINEWVAEQKQES